MLKQNNHPHRAINSMLWEATQNTQFPASGDYTKHITHSLNVDSRFQ